MRRLLAAAVARREVLPSPNGKGGQARGGNALWIGALFVVPALLYAPILYYSLHSPFSLVEGYSDWRYMRILESPSSFFAWLKWVVGIGDEVHPDPTRAGSRYRPFWQFYNAVMWTSFGANASAHHLARWMLHFGTVAFFCAAFCRICAIPSGRPLGSATSYLLPLCLLVYIWLFFPNSPAARLGPQEVPTTFFLGLCNYVAAVALSWKSQGGGSSQRKTRWLWLYGVFLLGFLCLTFSKEVNVALALCLLVAYFLFVCLMTKAGWRAVVAGVPLIAIVALAITRVYASTEQWGVGYGRAWSAYTSMANAAKMLLELLQVHTSVVLAAGFVALLGALAFRVTGCLWALRPALKNRRKDGEPGVHGGTIPVDRELAFVLFLVGQFLCTFGILAVSWGVVLRYWYPLVPLLSMLLAFAAKFVLEAAGERPGWSERRVAVPLVAFVVFHVGCNYYNFALQTVGWHRVSNAEEELIEEVRRLGDRGEHVVVEGIGVPACNLIHRVGKFLAFFRGMDFAVYTTPPETGRRYYFVTQKELPDHQKATTILGQREYRLLAAASVVASTLQLRREPFDRSAWRKEHKGRPYAWNIYRIPASYEGGRTVLPTLLPPNRCRTLR